MKNLPLPSENIQLTPEQIERLQGHFHFLQEKNLQFNLVSKNSLERAWEVHYLDSIYMSQVAKKFQANLPMADVGSGAGFPGLVFAILFPETPIHLYEKLQKKQAFLEEAREKLGLSNVKVFGGFLKKPELKFVMARAVFPKEEFFEFFRYRLQEKSRVLLALGGNTPSLENVLDFKKIAAEKYFLSEASGHRQAEVWEKVPRGT